LASAAITVGQMAPLSRRLLGRVVLLALPLAIEAWAAHPTCRRRGGAPSLAPTSAAAAPHSRHAVMCSGAGEDGLEISMDQLEGTSIEKPQFGGGSGGTATLEDSDFSVNTILKQLESIQQGTPKNIVILGTRHCSFLHQQIIEVRPYRPAGPRAVSSRHSPIFCVRGRVGH